VGGPATGGMLQICSEIDLALARKDETGVGVEKRFSKLIVFCFVHRKPQRLRKCEPR
jgi:hypothetical protein